MTVDLCLVHSAWTGALHGPPRPNASAWASWRCLAYDGGLVFAALGSAGSTTESSQAERLRLGELEVFGL